MAKKAPFLQLKAAAKIGYAFEYIEKHIHEYVIRDEGKEVNVKYAVRRFHETGEDKWVMHVLASNLGYFVNSLGKVVMIYGVDPCDYVAHIFDGLKLSMRRCDPERARLSYLGVGVFFYCRAIAEKEYRNRSKEFSAEGMAETFFGPSEGGDDEIADLDTLLASEGYYVTLHDDDDDEADADT
jgi:hypothetical protein